MKIQEFSFEEICHLQDVAKIIRQQITKEILMSCGARDYKFLDSTRLGTQFRVGAGNKRQFIEVELMASDTYEVTLFRLKAKTNEKIIVEQYDDVYCNQLGHIVYHAVNK